MNWITKDYKKYKETTPLSVSRSFRTRVLPTISCLHLDHNELILPNTVQTGTRDNYSEKKIETVRGSVVNHFTYDSHSNLTQTKYFLANTETIYLSKLKMQYSNMNI